MYKHISALLLTIVLVACLAGVTAATAPAAPAAEQAAPAAGEEQATASADPEEQTTEPAPDAGTTDAGTADDETADGEETDTVSSSLYLNDELVSGSGMYFFRGVLYGSVRAFFTSALPDAEITWANGQISVTGETEDGQALAVTAQPGDYYLTANNRCLYVAGGVQMVSGVTMAPVRVMASIFNGKLSWDAETATARVTLGDELLEDGDSFYDEQSLSLLAHLINAEAGNQPLLGKVAVGNVILNRVNSSRFPNSIHDVIYAQNQFTVVRTGAFERTPNASSIAAAKLALEGVCTAPGAYYFNRAGVSCWASRNCKLVVTIGNHAFYG